MNWKFAACGLLAGLFFAGPALAGDCVYMGQPSSEGARICQAGAVSVCTSQQWVATKETCDAPTVAVGGVSREKLGLHILVAGYRAGNDGTDVTDTLRDLCEQKEDCSFTADASILDGTPMPPIRGQLSVIFSCTNGFQSGDVQRLVYPGHSAVSLTCRK